MVQTADQPEVARATDGEVTRRITTDDGEVQRLVVGVGVRPARDDGVRRCRLRDRDRPIVEFRRIVDRVDLDAYTDDEVGELRAACIASAEKQKGVSLR